MQNWGQAVGFREVRNFRDGSRMSSSLNLSYKKGV
jgi:hypothetical protein